MGTFSRLRYVIAANVNALLEKAEDPEKLLRALIREMEDASEDARIASAELLAEEQRLLRSEKSLAEEVAQWQERAENAVSQDRDDLARGAIKARNELSARHAAVIDEQAQIKQRIAQMENDMVTLKSKLAEAKARLKSLQAGTSPRAAASEPVERLSPGEKKMRRAMDRFDRLQTQVDNLEARVRSYEVGGTAPSPWAVSEESSDPVIEAELAKLKDRIGAPAESEAEKVEE
jgi:phage shock protein A